MRPYSYPMPAPLVDGRRRRQQRATARAEDVGGDRQRRRRDRCTCETGSAGPAEPHAKRSSGAPSARSTYSTTRPRPTSVQ